LRSIRNPFIDLVVILVSAVALVVMTWAKLSRGSESSTLAQLEAAPVHKSDLGKDPETIQARRREIADAIDYATKERLGRAFLINTAIQESHLAEHVTEDHESCKEGKGGICDSGRAFGAWQLHGMKRTESKREQAVKALSVYLSGARYCQARGVDPLVGGISHYARGWGCNWKHAKKRAKQVLAILGKL
jgi:hypothetical protein